MTNAAFRHNWLPNSTCSILNHWVIVRTDPITGTAIHCSVFIMCLTWSANISNFLMWIWTKKNLKPAISSYFQLLVPLSQPKTPPPAAEREKCSLLKKTCLNFDWWPPQVWKHQLKRSSTVYCLQLYTEGDRLRRIWGCDIQEEILKRSKTWSYLKQNNQWTQTWSIWRVKLVKPKQNTNRTWEKEDALPNNHSRSSEQYEQSYIQIR